MSPRILIVEDNNNLGDTLFEYLQGIGYMCWLAKTALQAKNFFSLHHPSIVLMDIGLPDQNGIELARELKQKKEKFSLLFLSTLNDPEIKVKAFDLGAEDYITKPFALRELTIRLNKIITLGKDFQQEADELIFGPLKIWFKKYEVLDSNKNIIQLSQKECAILKLLYQKNGEVYTRNQIIDSVWGEDKFPSHRTVDNYIVKLRKWCETDKAKHIEIHSIRGIGYKLTITIKGKKNGTL